MTSFSFRPAVLALALLTAAPAAAQDVEFTLVNQSGFVLVEFYASPASDPNWGEDILGQQILAPDEEATVLIGGGGDQCLHDFQMVFDDGDVLTDQVDICTLASYTIN